MQQVLKAIKQGKSRVRASKIAKITTATITGWYNDGSENKRPNTKMFYDEFTRIKKELNKEKERQEKKSKAPTKRQNNISSPTRHTESNHDYAPMSTGGSIKKSNVDTSDRAKNLRNDIATRY